MSNEDDDTGRAFPGARGLCEGAALSPAAPVPILADTVLAEDQAATDTAGRERWALLADVGVMTGCWRMIAPAILSGIDGRDFWFLTRQLH